MEDLENTNEESRLQDFTMTTFDVNDALEKKGKNTWWIFSLFLLTSSPGILNSMHINSYVFLAEAPTTWCAIPVLHRANWTSVQIRFVSSPNPQAQENCQMFNWNYTELAEMSYSDVLKYIKMHSTPEEIPCQWGYSYEEPMPSISTQWDLVCENTPLRSTVQVAVAIGKLAGSFCFSTLADKFGRRSIFLFCCILYMIAGPGVALAFNYYILLLMRLGIGVAGAGVYEVGYTILSEMTLSKHRTWLGCLYNISYAVGITILPILAYFSSSWRVLQWYMSIPGFFLLIHCWFMPESPRWLVNRKQYKKAFKVLYGVKVPADVVLPQDENQSQERATCNHYWYKKLFSALSKLFQLFSSGELISRITICYLGWFTASMAYFVIALNADNFSFNKYWYIALNGIVEAPGYVLPIILMSWLGRKSSGVLLFGVAGVALIIIVALTGSAVVTVALLGRLCSSAMFAVIILHTSELFPTCIRNTAIGTSLTLAQVGTVAAPFVVDILGQKAWFLPSMVCGVMCLLSASAILLLPETKSRPLPESMDDIKNAPSEYKVSFKNCCNFR